MDMVGGAEGAELGWRDVQEFVVAVGDVDPPRRAGQFARQRPEMRPRRRLIFSPPAGRAVVADRGAERAADFGGVVGGAVIDHENVIDKGSNIGEDALEIAVFGGFVAEKQGANQHACNLEHLEGDDKAHGQTYNTL